MDFKRRVALLSIFTMYFLTGNAQNYPAVLDQNTLNGKNGFIIKGLNPGDRLGSELSFIGDINHDGLEDIAINTQFIEPDDLYLGGTTYIIFGSRNVFPSPFDLTTLNGTNGFKVEGIAEDERRGASIGKLGDINGDGIDDIALGSEGDQHLFLYGRSSGFPAAMTINHITAATGFIFTESGIGEIKGAGDVNGDGVNDIIMGQYAWSGTTYILFGRNSNFPLHVDPSWLDGTRGFYLGEVSANISAFYVGSAGDINDDGYDDIMVGIWSGRDAAEGLSYVYFGHAAPFTNNINLKNVTGTDGFAIQNTADYSLVTVGTLGDINGDGIDDCFSRNNIIYGSKGPFAQTFIPDGANGFSSTGFNQTSAAIGDVNSDGIGDFLVVSKNYENWVVYGSENFPRVFDPAVLNGSGGFKIKNIKQSNIGRQISGRGDVNGDGLSDFMIGSEIAGTDFNGTGEQGLVYVVFGGDHYAKPLAAGFPKVANISYTTFTLQVNVQEKGKVYYGIYPGSQNAVTQTSVILTGTNALQYGEIQAMQAAAQLNKSISGLTPETKYDIYVYFEDASGNAGDIYFLDNVTTLADTEAPKITCIGDQTLACGATVPDYTSSVAVTDNVDSNPEVTQIPVAGSVFNPDMTVTITAKDHAGNKSECWFMIAGAQQVHCPVNPSVKKGGVLPDYTQAATVTGFCNPAPVISQTPVPGTLIADDVIAVTLTAADENKISAACTFSIHTLATDVLSGDLLNDMKIYPNPAHDKIHIQGAYSAYEIIDYTGIIIMSGESTDALDIASLSDGVYVILLYDQEFHLVTRKKIIKN